jgi:hypothetical protein
LETRKTGKKLLPATSALTTDITRLLQAYFLLLPLHQARFLVTFLLLESLPLVASAANLSSSAFSAAALSASA